MSESVILSLIAAITGSILAPIIKAIIDKRARNQEHSLKMQDDKSSWQKNIEEKVRADETRLDSLVSEVQTQKEMDKLLLKGTMLITGHLCDGNHTELLRQYSKDIENFLIDTR